MPLPEVSSFLATSSILACGLLAELGGRAVISTAEMDSLVCRVFFVAVLRWAVAGEFIVKSQREDAEALVGFGLWKMEKGGMGLYDGLGLFLSLEYDNSNAT